MLLFLVVVAIIAAALWHFVSPRLAGWFMALAALVALLLLVGAVDLHTD